MAIVEEVILGEDCELQVGTALFSLGVIVNWDDIRTTFAYQRERFSPASASVIKILLPKEEPPALSMTITRGLTQTFRDFYDDVYGQQVTGFSMTDWPDFADLVSRYGPCYCVECSPSQPSGAGMMNVVLQWGVSAHGYTAA